jgi:hypothetical protein
MGEKVYLHIHVFIAIKGHSEVKKFDVKAHVFCIRGAEHTVPMEFGCCYVGCASCEFAGIVY